MKPSVTCVCEGLPSVPNRTGIYIVQHMRERGHAVGTARIAMLGLERAFQETVFPVNGLFQSAQVFLPGTALLYPGPGARHLETVPESGRPSNLAVIDGTWQQASKIYRDSPNLRTLPCVTFRDVKPSNYRIRLGPNEAANATIEAVCRALQILEPDTPGVDGLLSCFNKMIDRQLRAATTGNPRQVLRVKTYKQRNVPKYLKDENARLVLTCGERLPRDTPIKHGVPWTLHALRLQDGTTFSETLEPVPPSTELELIGSTDHRPGLSAAAFRAAWQRFIQPEDVIVSWGNKSVGRLFDATGPHPHFLFLKAVYGNLHRGNCGTLDELIAKEGIEPTQANRLAFDETVGNQFLKMIAVLTFLSGHRCP